MVPDEGTGNREKVASSMGQKNIFCIEVCRSK